MVAHYEENKYEITLSSYPWIPCAYCELSSLCILFNSLMCRFLTLSSRSSSAWISASSCTRENQNTTLCKALQVVFPPDLWKHKLNSTSEEVIGIKLVWEIREMVRVSLQSCGKQQEWKLTGQFCSHLHRQEETYLYTSLFIIFSVIKKPCCCGLAPSLNKCHAAVFEGISVLVGQEKEDSPQQEEQGCHDDTWDGAASGQDGKCERMTLYSTSGNCSNRSECPSMPRGSSDIVFV